MGCLGGGNCLHRESLLKLEPPDKKSDLDWQWASTDERQIRESQNHRMVGLGRDLCGSSSSTRLDKYL